MPKQVYAVAETVPNAYYLTAGKRYQVIDTFNGPLGFRFAGDDGGDVFALWYKCLHLSGGNWTRIEEETE